MVSASDVDANEATESLRDDLEKLFNTRRGTVLIDQSFGLPDFTHLMNGYSAPDVGEIQQDVLYQVREYEKRLSGVTVAVQEKSGSGNSLQFALNAKFLHKDQEHSLAANIIIQDNGSIGVNLS